MSFPNKVFFSLCKEHLKSDLHTVLEQEIYNTHLLLYHCVSDILNALLTSFFSATPSEILDRCFALCNLHCYSTHFKPIRCIEQSWILQVLIFQGLVTPQPMPYKDILASYMRRKVLIAVQCNLIVDIL